MQFWWRNLESDLSSWNYKKHIPILSESRCVYENTYYAQGLFCSSGVPEHQEMSPATAPNKYILVDHFDYSFCGLIINLTKIL